MDIDFNTTINRGMMRKINKATSMATWFVDKRYVCRILFGLIGIIFIDCGIEARDLDIYLANDEGKPGTVPFIMVIQTIYRDCWYISVEAKANGIAEKLK